jgi:hypothetical protein
LNSLTPSPEHAEPSAATGDEPTPPPPVALPSDLTAIHHQLLTLLRAPGQEGAWLSMIDGVGRRIRSLVERDADTALFLQVQGAQRAQDHYSSQHALFCAVVVDLCLQHLNVVEAERQSASLATLTMNVSMMELQNELIHRERTPTLDQRRVIDGHAQASAQLLRQVGVQDPTWLEIVELHHTDPPPETGYVALSPTQRLASVVRRVDVFTAKMSSRRFRAGMPATLAARAACLGPDGRPDVVGSAVIKSLGMYPPGSYVKLVSGEVAVVTRRGIKANEPVVASLVGRDGRPLAAATPRDTAERGHAVAGIVRPAEVRGPVPPVRVGVSDRL